MHKACAWSVVVLLACAVGCDSTPPTLPAPQADNTELQSIVAADQADREPAIGSIDWSAVGPRDAARRTRVLQLIAEDRLHTSKDFEQAALVF